MARLLTVPATGFGRPGIRKRTLTATATKVGPISLQMILILAGTLLGLFYLIQSNRVSTKSLELKSLEAQKTQIVEENERLQVEAARLQSIQTLKKSTEDDKAKAAKPAPATKASETRTTGNVRPVSDGQT